MVDWRVTVPPGREPADGATTGAGGGIKFSSGLEDIAKEIIFLHIYRYKTEVLENPKESLIVLVSM